LSIARLFLRALAVISPFDPVHRFGHVFDAPTDPAKAGDDLPNHCHDRAPRYTTAMIGCHTMFGEILPSLSNNRRAIAVDLQAHGRTPISTVRWYRARLHHLRGSCTHLRHRRDHLGVPSIAPEGG
jgi:hypothetical protein